MGNARKIGESQKMRTLELWIMGLDASFICAVQGISPQSLRRWIRNWEEFGSPVRPQATFLPRGRPPILSEKVLQLIQLIMLDEPDVYLSEMRQWLALDCQTFISPAALHTTLHRHNLGWRKLRRVAKQRDETVRKAFSDMMGYYFKAEQVVYIDETHKDERDMYRRNGWGPKGICPIKISDFTRGKKVSMIGCISQEGFLAADCYEGGVNSECFFDFMRNKVLPKTNPFPEPNSVIVLDNCSIHLSLKVRNLVESAGRILVFLPPYSPDYNPIEVAFHVIKQFLRTHGEQIRNSQDPCMAILGATVAITPDMARNLYRCAGWVQC